MGAALLPPKALDDAPALRAWTSDLLGRLPDANYNVFVYVVAFFKALLDDADANLLTPARLSAVLRATLLQRDGPAETLALAHHMDAPFQYLLTSPAL